MNERIRQLARQSTGASTIYMLEEEWEKFAELIIQECAITVIDRCEMRNADDVRRAEYHAKRIKQHFGVEE